MAQDNFFDQYDQKPAPRPAPVSSGPVYGAPPKPDKPDQPKTTYRSLSPAEVSQRGLPPGNYQVSSEGKIDALPGNDKIKPPFSPEDLKAANAEARDNIQTIQRLFEGSNSWFGTGFLADTMSGWGGSNAANVKTDIGKLNSSSALRKIIQMAQDNGGRNILAPMSGSDVEVIAKSVGNLDQSQSDQHFQDSLLPYLRAHMSAFLATGGTSDELKQILNASPYTKNYTTDEHGNVAALDMGGPGSNTPPDGGQPPSGGNPPGGGGALDAIAGGFGDIVHGVGDTVGIVANPLNQAVNAVFGSNLPTDAGANLQGLSGLPSSKDPTVRAINRAGSSAMTGGGAFRAAGSLANPGAVKNALGIMGKNPLMDAAAGGGGGLAASVAQQNDVGPIGQIMAAIGGGLLTHKLAGGTVNALVPKQPNALAQAASRQKVDLLPAEAGGPVAKALTTGSKASPISIAPIVKAAQRNNGQLASAAERAAASQGGSVSSDIAGLNIRDAANRFTKQSADRATRLYDRAFGASKGIKIKPMQTLAAIDDQIARLKQNPAENGSTINELERFRQNISEGVTVQGIRDARTQLSQGVFDGKLRGSSEQAMWKGILGNISEDVANGLNSVGRRDAANMFKVADKFWSDRVQHIDEVLQPILGKGKSGEEIVGALESMARGSRGGNARLSRLLANMTDKEAGNVRATVIERLGKATAGQQNAAGDQFSAGSFLTNWNKMTPQAKASLFSDKALRANLDDIATIAEGTKSSQAMANFSNTGVAIGGNLAAGGALAATHPGAAVFGAALQYATGKLLASPRFANILARTAKMPPAVAERTMKEQFAILGTREPALRADLSAVIKHFGNSVDQSPMRAAATEKEKH